MEKQIEQVLSQLPENPSYEVILAQATNVIENEVLTFENIRGELQVWNDWYNGNEGLPVDANCLTKKVLKEWMGTFINMDASYLATRVEEELEDRYPAE